MVLRRIVIGTTIDPASESEVGILSCLKLRRLKACGLRGCLDLLSLPGSEVVLGSE